MTRLVIAAPILAADFGPPGLKRCGPSTRLAPTGRTVQFGPKVDGVLSRTIKIVGVSDDLDSARQCEVDVQKALGSRATAARSQPTIST
jgi:hypothetical protein